MCLSPKLIMNPEFIRNRSFYDLYIMDGSEVRCQQIYPGVFNPVFVDAKSVPVDRCSDYYAVRTATGEVCPLFMPVCCGKCTECHDHRCSELRSRMMLEQMYYGDIPPIMVRLSYAPCHLPPDGVCKDHICKFHRRLHDYFRHQDLPNDWRIITFSEYSPEMGRAHYHCVVFGLDFNDFHKFISFHDIVQRCWPFGYVHTKRCWSLGALRYVSKYVSKDVYVNVPEGKNPNFWHGPRREGGIGSRFLELADLKNIIDADYPYVSFQSMGKVEKVFLPRYLREKIHGSLKDFISQKLINKYKRFVELHVALHELLYTVRRNDYLPMDKYFTDVAIKVQDFWNYQIDGVFLHEAVSLSSFNRLSSEFFFVRSEYKVYSLARRNFLKGLPLNLILDRFPTLCREFLTLYIELLDFRFDACAYFDMLAEKSHYQHILSQVVENLLLQKPIYDASVDAYKRFTRERWYANHGIHDLDYQILQSDSF